MVSVAQEDLIPTLRERLSDLGVKGVSVLYLLSVDDYDNLGEADGCRSEYQSGAVLCAHIKQRTLYPCSVMCLLLPPAQRGLWPLPATTTRTLL